MFSTAEYWRAFHLKLPALSVIVRVAQAACATEAATERTFSSEAAIHTAARNRMATAKVQNRTKIRWNFEPIKQFALQAEELPEELKEIRNLYRPHDGNVSDPEVALVDDDDDD